MSPPYPREAILNNFRDEMRRVLTQALANEVMASTCMTCIHFKEKEGELCGLYKLRPPARIIAYGCPDYMDNMEVPF